MINLRRNDPHDGTLRDLAPDLTPMLDILFILLVFFMLTAGTVLQSLSLELPEDVSKTLSQVETANYITLEIHPNFYKLDGKKHQTLAGTKDAIKTIIANKPDHDVIIASDKKSSIERLLSLLTFLQSQGIETANILMKQEAK